MTRTKHTGAGVWSRIAWALVLLLISAACAAKDGDRKWSFTPLLGVSSPSLNKLNNGVFQSPVQWSGNIVTQPTGASQTENITLVNPLPKLKYGSRLGLEVAYHFSSRDALELGFTTWDASSTSTAKVVLPFQGKFSNVFYERTGDFQYNSFHIGWRHRIFGGHGKWRINTHLGLREVFDANYRENLVFLFQTGPAQSFKRIIQVIPKATGVLMIDLGLGGEYFFTDWLSVGLRAGYSFGVQPFHLNNASIKSDFQANDNVGTILLPMRPGSNGQMQYLLPNGQGYSDLTLRLNGWNTMLAVTIYR